MIFVDRTKVVAPAILTTPGLAGLAERDRAVANFGHGGPGTKFSYSVYRHSDVKDALITLFNKKCAYCESTFLHTYFGDVEHFRPKGEITEAVPPIAPGYYWLASDWDNLLLSCKLCNSHKTHKIHGSPIEETLGKMNQFPLDNFLHVRSHLVGINSEEPHRLLIDPCKDDPEQHLDYGEEGNILPKRNVAGARSIKGERSIKVYALQRIDLVDVRKELRIAIEVQQQRVLDDALNFLENIDAGNSFRAERYEQKLSREMQILKDFTSPQRPFSAMAKQMINRFLIEEHDHIVAKVV